MSRYSQDLNKQVRGDAVTPIASAARTANGNTGWLNAEEYHALMLTLAVTAHQGTTPTLDVLVETASDNVGSNARTVASFTQVGNANGQERKSLAPLDRYYRISWTIGGSATPGYTFSVAGDAK